MKTYDENILIRDGRRAVVHGDYKKALGLFEEAHILAIRTRSKSDILAAQNWILRTELLSGLESKTELDLSEMLDAAKALDNREILGITLVNLGMIRTQEVLHIESDSFKENIIDNTVDVFKQAIDIFERLSKDDKESVSRVGKLQSADAFERFSLFYIEMGDYDGALVTIQKAKELAKELDDPYLKARVYQGLGYIYYEKGDFESSVKNYKFSLKYWLKLDNLDSLSVVEAGLGEGYLSLKKYKSSLAHFQEALKNYDKLKVKNGYATMLSRIGKVYIAQGEVKQARKCFEKGVRIFKGISNRRMATYCKIGALDTEFLLGNKRFAKKMMLNLLYAEPIKQYPESYNYLFEVVKREKWLREEKEFKEMFEEPEPVTIEKHLMEEVMELAKEAFPNEFGALLIGMPHIHDLDFPPDTGRGHTSVTFNLYNRFSQRSVGGDGVVHSHPSGSANPSKADISMFGRFPGVNIIIGYPFKWDSWAAYDRFGNRVKVEVVDDKKK
jgi:tetratricopeptide (TPR) repeat protein